VALVVGRLMARPARRLGTRLTESGFGAAFWARPEAYLDPAVQAGMSWLAMLPDAARRRGTERLRIAIESGEWDRRHGHLRTQAAYDGGYRLAIAQR